jgi:hypothetical protein
LRHHVLDGQRADIDLLLVTQRGLEPAKNERSSGVSSYGP